ncbi:ribosomal protein L21 [Rhizobium herbae]|nr:ribosomal protein L21 [Rhizobium herbae]
MLVGAFSARRFIAAVFGDGKGSYQGISSLCASFVLTVSVASSNSRNRSGVACPHRAGSLLARFTGKANALSCPTEEKDGLAFKRRAGTNMKGYKMFAVIKTGGKQYRVAANDVLTIEKLEGAAGDKIEFTEILMVGVGADATIGAPFVEGAVVSAEVVEHGRAKKVIAFKKRRRQNSKRTRGHRQHNTTVRILDIAAVAGAKAKKASKKSEDAAAEAAN